MKTKEVVIIRYRGAEGTRILIAMSPDLILIEQAMRRAKDRIGDLGIEAYTKRQKEIANGVQHDPGQMIKGFPNWEQIYREEFSTLGIQTIPCSNAIVYETKPFEKFDEKIRDLRRRIS